MDEFHRKLYPEKMYSHGHAIGGREAAEIGLPVERPNANLEKLIWYLYCEYETLLQLNEPIDPEELLEKQNQEQVKQHLPLAVIESTESLNLFEATVLFQRKRQVPTNPQININFTLGLPPGYDLNQLDQSTQQLLQQLIGQVSQILPQLVQQEIVRQSPVVGIEGKVYGGKWVEKKEDMV